MPEYDFDCAACGVVTVSHSMREVHPGSCPKCGCADFNRIWPITAVRAPSDNHWQLENDGRGRHIPQLGAKSDPNAYCRSVHDVSERAKARGQKFERD